MKKLLALQKKVYNDYISKSENVSKNNWKLTYFVINKEKFQIGTDISRETFSEYFETIAHNIISSLPRNDNPPTKLGVNECQSPLRSFFLAQISTSEVESLKI